MIFVDESKSFGIGLKSLDILPFKKCIFLPDIVFESTYTGYTGFSDAVGHSMVDYLKEFAEKHFTDLEYQSKITKYSNNKPFTKESLLYRW